MLRRILAALCFLLMSLAVPVSAWGAPIVIVSQERLVRYQVDGTTIDEQIASDFGLFDAAVGPGIRATQTSTIDPLLLAASGSADSSSGPGGERAFAFSFYSVIFDVTADTPYSLDGTIQGSSLDGFTSVELVRLQPTSASIEFARSQQIASIFAFDGVLTPGRYELEITAIADSINDANNTSYTVTFAVPEPGSAAMVALGLLGIGIGARADRESGARRSADPATAS